MGRDRKKNPKRHQYCLRLTDHQAELLSRYADFRDFDSEVDAVRAMIDGLEDWFRRQEAKSAASAQGSTSVPNRPEGPHSGHSAQPDPSDESDEDTSVGDFAGRPSVGLPGARHDGQE